MPPEGVPLIQQGASENLLRLYMSSHSTLAWLSPLFFMRQGQMMSSSAKAIVQFL